MVKGRRQVNFPDDVIEILQHFSQKYSPPGVELHYSDIIRAMAAKLEPKKFGKK